MTTHQTIIDSFGSTYSVGFAGPAIKTPLIEQRVRVVHDAHPQNPLDEDELVTHFQLGGRGRGHVQDGRHFHKWLAKVPSYQVWEKMKCAALGVTEVDEWCDGVPDWEDASEVREFISLMPDVAVATVQRDLVKFIVLDKPKAEAEGIDWAQAQAIVDSMAEVYEQWCNGECFGVIVEQRVVPDGIEDCDDDGEAWEEIDACWGFYGLDFMNNGMSDHVPAELHVQLQNAEVDYNG